MAPAAGKASSAKRGTDVKLPGYTDAQVQKAAASLLKFVGDRDASNKLFEDDEFINMTIALKKMPLQSKKHKPVPLALPHPLHALEGAEVCLFVKDHKGEGHKQGKELVAKFEKNGGVTKVIGLSKLKTKYESYEAKRQLCKMYDLFLADDRILPSLPKLIGKSFFKVRQHGRGHAACLHHAFEYACKCVGMHSSMAPICKCACKSASHHSSMHKHLHVFCMPMFAYAHS
eukprot:362143-Chlamydomonas_euryale.AAC.6